MVKTITINGISCRLKSSAAIPRIYRIRFGRDIFVDMQKLSKQIERNDGGGESDLPIESLELFENIAYVMHKHGDREQPDDINDWLDQFETFDIYEVLPEILTMWKIENWQMSEGKKKKAGRPGD